VPPNRHRTEHEPSLCGNAAPHTVNAGGDGRRKSSRIQPDWRPSERVFDGGAKQGVGRTRVDDQIGELVLYSADTGAHRKSWHVPLIDRLRVQQRIRTDAITQNWKPPWPGRTAAAQPPLWIRFQCTSVKVRLRAFEGPSQRDRLRAPARLAALQGARGAVVVDVVRARTPLPEFLGSLRGRFSWAGAGTAERCPCHATFHRRRLSVRTLPCSLGRSVPDSVE